MKIQSALLCGLLLTVFPAERVLAQSSGAASQFAQPRIVEVLGVSVEGASDEYTRSFVLQTSGIAVGQQVNIPGDPAFGEAIRAIYRLRTYEDVQIAVERQVGEGVFLVIRVREVPKLREYTFTGVSGGDEKDIRKRAPLLVRSAVTNAYIARTEQVIKDHYAEEGRSLATVDVVRTVNEDNTVSLEFVVDKGPKVPVKEVVIRGNEEVDSGDLKGGFDTKPRVWWKFWARPTFHAGDLQDDLDKLVENYNERGYFNARVVADTTYLVAEGGDDPKMMVEITVEEGEKYFIREVNWVGNSLYSDEVLTTALDLKPGDPYNSKKLINNLYGTGGNTDISSLYRNSGHMTFNVQQRIKIVGADSMDIEFDIYEGDVFSYGVVDIGGNTKTREHVIRRELTTIPGNTFSQDQIQESVRRLLQMNYFVQESLASGPTIEMNPESKTVDLKYNLEEQGSDQLELSGTWGQFGLVLQLRFAFNNFSAQRFFQKSAWKPLPSGDGQKLSLGLQTNGRRYQQYSLSFTEPWFRGKPTPIGFSVSYSRIQGIRSIGNRTGGLRTFSLRGFYEQRLNWPDPFFRTSTTLGYTYYDNRDYLSTLPRGISQTITVQQAISRNSTNHPYFPSSGSSFRASVEIAPPLGDLIQYHKWRTNLHWYMPLSRKLSISVGSNFGYIGSLTGDPVQFERFIVGGSPFETQGFYNFFGKDIIYMRGYPLGVIGPRENNDPFGGRVLNKFTSELLWMAIQSQALQAAPYLFLDGANTWDSMQSYNPTDLYRSAGFGMRMFLPILGLIELTYGYNYDTFPPVDSGHSGANKWTFQFSLGQGFGQ